MGIGRHHALALGQDVHDGTVELDANVDIIRIRE